jgi:2-C-methyl-D-erythritol 4-phosphate cytidylyltransferase
MIKRFVIIVAGGSGERMKSPLPKQFIEIKGKPVLMHTIETFYGFDNSISIVVVLPADQIGYWKDVCIKGDFSIPHDLVAGGETRFGSVKNGLDVIPDNVLVAIHDGVRPFVNSETIGRCFCEAEKYGNAIPCISVNDTVRRVDNYNSFIIDRLNLRLIQTPQVFLSGLIKESFNQPYLPDFTDDASVFEKSGGNVHLVEGNRENIKITDPFDLFLAEFLINRTIV